MKFRLSLFVLGCVLPLPAIGQGVTGGTLGVELNAPTDFSDLGGTTYFGSLEYQVTPDISVAANVSSYRFDNLGSDASNATVHGIYKLDDETSVGLFFGQDFSETSDSDLYGIQGTTWLGGSQVEGYLGRVDGQTDEITILGFDGQYDIRSDFSVTGSAALGDYAAGSARTISIGASYTIADGPDLYAEIGNVSVAENGLSTSDTFIGVGAQINFGGQKDTTFGRRSFFEILPQF